ncbi:MAG: CPBP family intramembrane metalloprotease [Phycisphaerales bacterium]|nr:CPBP family intramembrane metalloprotease [Phycisphaerales bacterium]
MSWIVLTIGLLALGGFAAFLIGRPGWLQRTACPRPVSPPRLVIILTWQLLIAPVLMAVLGPLVLSTVAAEQATMRDLAQQTLVAQAITLPLVALFFWMGRLDAERAWVRQALAGLDRAGRRAGPGKAVGMGILGLVVGWPIVLLTSEAAGFIREIITGQRSPLIAHKTLEQIGAASPGDPWLIAMALAVVVMAPVIEEVIYRGALLGCLRGFSRSPWTAIVLSAALFAAMHIGTAADVAIPGLFVFGVGLGIVYERSGTLLAPMVMHGLFNLGNIVLLLALSPGA